MSKSNRVILNVPYEEKEEAKQRGAKWDPSIKRWYVDDDQSLDNFSAWTSQIFREHAQEIKSPIYILESKSKCWSCAELTPLYAIAGKQLLEGFEPEEEIYIFSYISKIDSKIAAALEKLCPTFYLNCQKSSNLSYFMNHCLVCNVSQGDHYIHDEISGPFCFEVGENKNPDKVEKLDLSGSFFISAKSVWLKREIINSWPSFEVFENSDKREDFSSEKCKDEKIEKKDLSLIKYWKDVLVRSAFDAYGNLKSVLENIDKFSWENAENILKTVLCKDLENLASSSISKEALSKEALVRHLVMLAEPDSGSSFSKIVLFVFPLKAKLKDQEEAKENGIQYDWVRADNEPPIFNYRLLGEEAEIDGFHLLNEKSFNKMLSDQFSSDDFPVSASLDQCLSFIDKCFSSLTEDADTCEKWIQKFYERKRKYPLLRNKKIVFRLVDGNLVSGTTKSIRRCYNEILAMKGVYQQKCKLFYHFTGIESLGFQATFEENQERESWKSPSLYLGNMDNFSSEVGRSYYPLDPSQRLALTLFKKVKDGGVLAVNGPPGTGKTSFLRAVIADHWVQPLLSDELSPVCPIILAVAATNQAVTNIISTFDTVPGPSLFHPDGERNTARETLESRWIPFLSAYGWYHPASVSAKADDYKNYQLISWSFSEKEWKFHAASKNFNPMKERIASLENAYISVANQFFGEKDSLQGHAKKLRDKVKSINKKLNSIESLLLDWKKSLQDIALIAERDIHEEACYALAGEMFGWKSLNNDFRTLLNKIDLLELRNVVLKDCRKRVGLFSKSDILSRITLFLKYKDYRFSKEAFWQKLLGVLSENYIDYTDSDSDRDLLLRKITSKIEENKQVIESLKADKRRLENDMALSDAEYKKLKKLKEEKFHHVKNEQRLRKTLIDQFSLLSLNFGLEDVCNSIASKFHASQSFNREEAFQNLYSSIQDKLDTVVRPQLFHMCARYWEAQYILSRKEGRVPTDDSLNRLRELAMLAPVFVATAYSAPKLMRNRNPVSSSDYMYGAADFLIVDEAGQSSPEIGSSSFLFARRALVVGDTKQLNPVWSFSVPMDKLIYSKHCSSHDYNVYKTQGALSSSGSVMKMAQDSTSYYDFAQEPKGVMLTRHYRCREPIINICNEMIYGSALEVVKAATEPKLPWDLPLAYLVVSGESTKMTGGSRCNYEEAKWVARWIKEKSASIIAHYGSGPDGKKLSECIAVLAPFKGQVSVLEHEIAKAFLDVSEDPQGLLDPHNIVVGTVHSMQGSERPIVLFSMTDTAEIDSDHFYDSDPSIINVAVSRAKEVFIVAMDQKAVDYGRKLKPQRLRKPSDHLFYHVVNHGQRVNSKRLMIIESPNKVNHIAEALSQGMELEILATVGHLAQLDSCRDWDPLAADSPKWQVLSELEERLYRRVATLWPDLEAIYIATDPDAEGECIAWQFLSRVKEHLPLDAPNRVALNRMIFYSLTPHDIRSAYLNPRRGLDPGLVKSALFRTILDQIIARHYPHKIGRGDKNKFAPGVGRVQLAIMDILDLLLTASKEDEKYFIEVGSNAPDGDEIKFILSDCKTSDPVLISEKAEAEKIANTILTLLKKKSGMSLKYRYKLEQMEEYPAINTAKLLSLCDSECNIFPSDAMRALQDLYEGYSPVLKESPVELV